MGEDGKVRAVFLHDLKYGDKVKVFDQQSSEIKFELVVFVDLFDYGIEREMIKVTLDTGVSVTVTPRHHLVEVMDDGSFNERPSKYFKVGQTMMT